MVPTLRKPNTALFVLLLFPFCSPVGLTSVPAIKGILTLWKFAALAYLILVMLPKCFSPHPKKKPLGFIGLGLFWLIYVVGCIRAGADVASIFTAAVSSMLILLLIRYEVSVGNGRVLLKGMSYLSVGCILAHILSVIGNVAGITSTAGISGTNVYLFGMDNYSAFFIYPMLCIVLFYHSLHYGRLKAHSWCLMLAVAGIYMLTSSMTAAGAGLLLIGLCLVHSSWHKLPKVRGVRWVIVVFMVLLVLICGFQVQNLLSSLLDSMSKGVTLNSRTYIWDCALKLIRERPVFGHGSFTQEQIDSYILYGTTHAHNLLLELLMRTGVVGTVFYLMFLCGFTPVGRSRLVGSPHKDILLAGLLCQMILTFMDFYPTILVFYMFMGLMYVSDDLDMQFRHQQKEPV